MALQPRSPAVHNAMVGRVQSKTKKIPHPTSTRFHESQPDVASEDVNEDDDPMFETPTAKRRKLESKERTTPLNELPKHVQSSLDALIVSTPPSATKVKQEEDTDVIEDGQHGQEHTDEGGKSHTTQLEAALPQISTDAEAIEEYEAYRAAEAAEKMGDSKRDALKDRMTNRSWTRGQSSIYVDAFNLTLHTVLEDESHLFNEAEKRVFQYWEELSYECQYLYVRLFLRKTSTWFRVGKLGYYGDIADLEGAVEELQLDRQLPQDGENPQDFPGEQTIPDEAQPLGESFHFAERSDEQITSLDEASSLLLLDELKVIAKEARVGGKNKTELLKNLRRTSGKQRGLGFMKRSETEDSIASEKSESVYDGDEGTPDGALTPNDNNNRNDHFTKKILERTGSCIRLSLIPLKLFERVHLVFYRSTEWTDKSLTTLILAKISRRNFPDYIVSRSANIFESRSLLLEFEASLRTQFRVDSILELNGTPSKYALGVVRSIFEAVYPRWQALVIEEQRKEDRVYESGEGAYLRRFSPAWVYTRIVHKALAILAKFKEHLREHELLCELLDQRLFHAARRGLWYSRKALLEEHYMYALNDAEGRTEENNKKYWKRIALQTCQDGLQDNECHVIYHYDLQKRIKKLEKQLRVPKREQHDFGHVGLLKALERTVEGIKIEREESSRPSLRRRESTADEHTPSRSRERSTASTPTEPPRRAYGGKTIWLDELDTSEPVSVEAMCLSHYRKVLGYKGYHSEGGILRTLFGLLFHDVLFATYIPNVFQTAYQTCPLDLHSDAFYSARISEINAQVNRITNGEAEDIMRQTWEMHFERRTCIIGVRWETYEFEDLIEIVRCWDGEALGIVMRVLAQEYGNRGGGVPDLFLWKVNEVTIKDENRLEHQDEVDTKTKGSVTDTTKTQTSIGLVDSRNGGQEKPQPYGKVMFSEVKSENDRLSDTQRLWISVLLNAGVEVELCHAAAKEVIVR